jgi:hypothetical protein
MLAALTAPHLAPFEPRKGAEVSGEVLGRSFGEVPRPVLPQRATALARISEEVPVP